ncbi:tryptophan--tRNA ligase [Candidatus Micrarchaeota archaeon]|nr:tryptophan--tRNA ligase [Candidatus Micrarchaeota archaeon]
MIVDPWTSETVDYKKIMKEFGINPISQEILPDAEQSIDMRWFKNNIIFAHRDLDKIFNAKKQGKPVAVLSGIKPSGEFHFGSKQVVEELVMFQKLLKCKVYYCVADYEAYADNGDWIDKTKQTAVSNIADVFALGLDPKHSYVYLQSKEPIVQEYAFYFSKKITNATFKAVYGDKPLSLYMSALIQIGDILLPQHPSQGGPKNVLVPVGVDQDPHIRLTRDVAEKNGFISPSSTYHYFIRSLDGSQKMSKRNPDSMLTFADSDKDIKRKISRALTGGRDTVEEQKKKGGNPEKCTIIELSNYHIESIAELQQRINKCKTGQLLCGECKQQIITKLTEFISKHRKKKEKFIPLATAIVERGIFDGESEEGKKLIKKYLGD